MGLTFKLFSDAITLLVNLHTVLAAMRAARHISISVEAALFPRRRSFLFPLAISPFNFSRSQRFFSLCQRSNSIFFRHRHISVFCLSQGSFSPPQIKFIFSPRSAARGSPYLLFSLAKTLFFFLSADQIYFFSSPRCARLAISLFFFSLRHLFHILTCITSFILSKSHNLLCIMQLLC